MPVLSISESEIRFILEGAIQAPSADNRLPIRFRIGTDAIEVHLHGELPIPGGYRELLLLLTLGALAENAAIAATKFSIKLTIDAPTRLQSTEPILRLRSVKTDVPPDPLYQQLHRRHTNRRVWFHGPALSQRQRQEIEESLNGKAGGRIHWIDSASRSFVIKHMTCAETERFRNPILHQELFNAIRFDLGWEASSIEGLPPGALQIERAARPLFTALRRWSVARQMNRLGLHHLLGLRSCYLPCTLAPDLGAITVADLDVHSLIEAGRSFQRAWLVLTQLDRVLQPLPAAALYALPVACREGVPEVLQQYLRNAWRDQFRDRWPVLFFRVGKAAQGEILTHRPSIDALMLRS